MNKPKILFYDIETSLLSMWGFRMGEQRINHHQLMGGYFSRSHIICISYSWYNEKTVHTLDWGVSVEDEKRMIQEFDTILREADIVIGKNSDSFDNKHINTHRLWNDLEAMPQWLKSTDDLERQLRRYFDVPSQSLDYWSSQFGLGGKDKMEFGDWVAINRLRMLEIANFDFVEHEDRLSKFLFNTDSDTIVKQGYKALSKMEKYNKKDVRDTKAIWKLTEKHFTPKNNVGVLMASKDLIKDRVRCRHCGGMNVIRNGSRISGQNIYYNWTCKDCKTYAGRSLKEEPTKLS